VPFGYWDDANNQRQFLDFLKVKLGLKKMEDWYSIKRKQFDNGGMYLLWKYDGSPQRLLQNLYPDYPWQPWKFKQGVASGYWDNLQNQRKFLDAVGKELNFQRLDDWYRIDAKVLMEKGGTMVLKIHKDSPFQMLKSVIPEYPWQKWRCEEEFTLLICLGSCGLPLDFGKTEDIAESFWNGCLTNLT
jgi:hypothetical protein